MFEINTTSSAPIWQQIEEGMRRMIELSALRPGEPVPSVRDLARSLRVNPNTVARAYQRLTERGVLTVKRGDGTYVADQPVRPKKAERSEKLREAATQYAGTALSIGAPVADAAEELENAYRRLGKEPRRG